MPLFLGVLCSSESTAANDGMPIWEAGTFNNGDKLFLLLTIVFFLLLLSTLNELGSIWIILFEKSLKLLDLYFKGISKRSLSCSIGGSATWLSWLWSSSMSIEVYLMISLLAVSSLMYLYFLLFTERKLLLLEFDVLLFCRGSFPGVTIIDCWLLKKLSSIIIFGLLG